MSRKLSTKRVVLGTFVAVLFAAGNALALDYVVRPGDTLTAIARQHNTTVAEIQRLNNLSGNLIIVGQTLTLPDQFRDYTVVGGDTLTDIANRFNTTVAAIKRANNLVTNLIVVGQRLRIPLNGSSGSSSGSDAGAFAGGSSSTLSPGVPAGSHPAVRRVARMNASATELEVMARIIKGECPAPTPFEGKVAVGAVILNRVRSRRHPNSIVGVCHQPLQFSCYNRNVRQRLYYGSIPQWAWDAARAALDGLDPTAGSTHYFNPYLVAPSWKNSLQFVRRIENTSSRGLRRLTGHDFYRPRGLGPVPTRGAAGRVGQ